ncbi:MAG: flippase-like domain-containing protein [Bryobacteraceae bacterium]|nr:flippase-like domain-containing protein [Bryobacteraceae bacterium]
MFALKCGLAAGLIWWLVASGRLQWQVLVGLQFGAAFAGLFACRLAVLVLPVVRWQRLVAALGLKLSLAQAVHIGLIGGFFGVFAPASIGQDSARLLYGTRENEGQAHEIVSSILADRLVGLASLALLAFFWGAVFMISQPDTAIARAIVAASLALLAVGATGTLAALGFPRVVEFLRRWRPAQRVVAGVWAYRLRKRALLEALAISCASHSFVMAASWLAFVTLGVSAPFVAVGAITPLISISYGIPLTPMGLGVSDSVGDALYRLIGVAEGAEVSVVLRAVALLMSAACGAAFLLPVFRTRNGSAVDRSAPDTLSCQ